MVCNDLSKAFKHLSKAPEGFKALEGLQSLMRPLRASKALEAAIGP